VLSFFNISFTLPNEDEEVVIKSLISTEGLRFIVTSMIDNFISFKPLGIVLTMMLGIGIANKVGLLETFIKSTILKAPQRIVTYAIIFTGILGNLAADAAFIIVPPLAAMVFYNINRHPLAGLAAGFAGVGAGFTANIIVSNTDAVLSDISAEVMSTLNTETTVTPVDNYYFMLTSVLFLTLIGGFITEKIIEPQLGKYQGNIKKDFKPITATEKKKLFFMQLLRGFSISEFYYLYFSYRNHHLKMIRARSFHLHL